MNLTTEDLVLIAEKVKQLDAADLDVSALRVSGHDVYLRKLTKDGKSHIVGISSKQSNLGAMRGE